MSLYIFLDIDGVMVPAKGWKAPELMTDGFPGFSKKAVTALNTLVSHDTVIMLTTSHKSSFSLLQWKDIFRRRGIADVAIQSLPHNAASLPRKDEIVNWFSANQSPENFVIIDDDTRLNDLPYNLKQKLVLTSPYIGLTEENLAGINMIKG